MRCDSQVLLHFVERGVFLLVRHRLIFIYHHFFKKHWILDASLEKQQQAYCSGPPTDDHCDRC